MILEGKVALVTGAGRGIGKAIALHLARDGADVAVADIDEDTAEQTSIDIRELGRNSMSIKVDLGDPDDMERMVSDAASGMGGIDILVNNAGITWHRDFLDITLDDWDRIHRVNARGVFFCMQRVAREMVEQGRGGRIINIASIAGKGYKSTSNAAYAASKGAVISMTYLAAHYLGEHDITVNAICPGITRTSLLENIIEGRSADTSLSHEEVEAQMAEGIPIGKITEVEDVAAMAAFLAGPGGRTLTGQTYNIDGGLIMG